MSTQKEIAYFSTIRGQADQINEDYVYYGLTFRVKREEVKAGGERVMRVMQDQFEAVEDLIHELESDYEVGEIIERYEVFEHSTGDMLVLYRIPACEHSQQTVGR
jgi:hypothetical protein